ncbi:alpha-ketoglutarate-dependent dioxygenase AlkB [Echinicola marina]|uniref:alpha-ketoglutarate-dependent dioxygenase AlkB family protein n=1 Tax=Echinicola marina TaxID=2859768 RepID=UPI001CF634E7|nr:alpha-ketoglutarate-dependent dioxygenase AlkB [Echinicola marina]UCS92844.1 alpha-ketoglutarate-dependent dioxygenase AlkB [Echinicola marina]
MDLFNQNSLSNLLPYDGTVHYYGKILSDQQSLFFFERLMSNIEWQHDEAIIYGKHYITKRKVAWYGDLPYTYSYSNTCKKALPWTEELKHLKSLVEEKSSVIFNSCLLNLYHNGTEGMAYHSDSEKSLGENTVITSLSLGAERKFTLKHKNSKQTVSILLENGSLLVMKGSTQSHWLHRLPPTKKVTRPRISLTFRTIVDQ